MTASATEQNRSKTRGRCHCRDNRNLPPAFRGDLEWRDVGSCQKIQSTRTHSHTPRLKLVHSEVWCYLAPLSMRAHIINRAEPKKQERTVWVCETAICFSTPHYLPLNNAPGNLIKGHLFSQQYSYFLQARNLSPALLKRTFKDDGVQGASHLQLFMKWERARKRTRQLILWNVRGNRRARIRGGVGEKLSKIA